VALSKSHTPKAKKNLTVVVAKAIARSTTTAKSLLAIRTSKSVPQATVARTRVINNSQNPKWNEQFYIPLAHPLTYLEFKVKDDDIFGAELIGNVKIPAQ
jgi:Ca2+-dependent lipid-binding protein